MSFGDNPILMESHAPRSRDFLDSTIGQFWDLPSPALLDFKERWLRIQPESDIGLNFEDPALLVLFGDDVLNAVSVIAETYAFKTREFDPTVLHLTTVAIELLESGKGDEG